LGADGGIVLDERRAIARLTMPDDPAAAAEQWEGILDVSERVNGRSHQLVQSDRGSLAGALEAAGELQRSLDECEQLLRVAVEHFADDPVRLWYTRFDVARLSFQLEDFPRAIALCEENLAADEPVSADLWQDRVRTKLMQAEAYRIMGRLNDATRTVDSAVIDAAAHLPRTNSVRGLCDQRSAEIHALQPTAADDVAPDA
jgi:tetratricopeptide (TPR) repeat protein